MCFGKPCDLCTLPAPHLNHTALAICCGCPCNLNDTPNADCMVKNNHAMRLQCG